MSDAATQAGEGDEEDDDDSIAEESDQERNVRYLNADMNEVSDPDLWMNLHHHSDEDEDSEENAEESELDTTQRRVLQALYSDDDRISNPAMARWLLARLDRRIAEADEATRAAYFPLADRISTAIRNLRLRRYTWRFSWLEKNFETVLYLESKGAIPYKFLDSSELQHGVHEHRWRWSRRYREHQPTRSRSWTWNLYQKVKQDFVYQHIYTLRTTILCMALLHKLIRKFRRFMTGELRT